MENLKLSEQCDLSNETEIKIFRAFTATADVDKVNKWVEHIRQVEKNPYQPDANFELYNAIKDEINNLILQNSNSNSDMAYSGQYIEIAGGGTVCCYRHKTEGTNLRPAILKEFRPLYGNKRFSFLSDSQDQSTVKPAKILKDFLRFLEQKDGIGGIVNELYLNRVNTFSAPQIYLSSLGLVYLDTAFCGEILSETIDKRFGDWPKSFDDLIVRIEVVSRIAESVEAYHKGGYFNGDIKPDNLYQIENQSNPLVVVNIDYDTCIKMDEIDKAFFSKEIRTTRAFYCVDGIKNLSREDDLGQAKEYLLKYDVAAIANILIFILLNKERRTAVIKNTEPNSWYTYGFKSQKGNSSSVSEKLFEVFGCRDSLVGRAIYGEIVLLLKNTLFESDKKRYNIERFITHLNVILAMLRCCENGNLASGCNKTTFSKYLDTKDNKYVADKILWFANLHQLNRLTGKREYTMHDTAIEVTEDIKKLFYEQ